jgi:hypothetical protein
LDTEVSAPVVQLNYDYDRLPKEHRAVAMHAACQIKLLATVTVEAVVRIGAQLHALHELLTGKGCWIEWIREEFDWSDATARKYLDIYQFVTVNPEATPNLTKMGVETLALLARRDTTREIRRQAVDIVRRGQVLTLRMVKDMINLPAEEPPPKAKKPKAAATPEDLALIMVGIVNIYAEVKAHAPGTVAAAVSPLLRRRYREDVAALVEWLRDLVEDLGDGTDAQAAE